MQHYWPFVLQGFVLGIGLAVMMGPIFVALTKASIERGGKAGFMVGLGIWISDALIILGSYLFISQISVIVQDGVFKYWMGMLGGFILVALGIGTMVKKEDLTQDSIPLNLRSYLAFWTKGFLVNTINPFTFIFWIGVISTYVIGKKVSHQEAAIFLSTIFCVIIITDSTKVLLAKYMRNRLTPRVIDMVVRGAGFLLLLFGLLLIYRTS